MILGVMWVMFGLAILGSSGLEYSIDEAVLFVFIPREARATLWIVSGLLGAASSIRAIPEWIGFMSLVVMPMQRVVAYLWSFLMWVIPGLPGGSLVSLWEGIGWASFTFLVAWIASWHEPDHVRKAAPDADSHSS